MDFYQEDKVIYEKASKRFLNLKDFAKILK